MRYFFVFLLLAHGLIRLMGFAKAFKFAEISQLTQPISRPAGFLWLIAALLFTVAAVLFFLQKDSWWMVALPAVVISQGAIYTYPEGTLTYGTFRTTDIEYNSNVFKRK